MLPDTVHLIPEASKGVYVRLLAQVARSDGLLTEEERSNWESRAGLSLLSDEQRIELRKQLENCTVQDTELKKMEKDHLMLALRDSMLMAAVDGHYDPREIDAIKEIAALAKIDDEQLIKLFEWVEQGVQWMCSGRELLGLPTQLKSLIIQYF